MALKDWRKTFKTDNLISWKNDKNIEYLDVKKTGQKWEVNNLRYGGRTTILYENLTKQQAISKAKSYMRSH